MAAPKSCRSNLSSNGTGVGTGVKTMVEGACNDNDNNLLRTLLNIIILRCKFSFKYLVVSKTVTMSSDGVYNSSIC